MFSTNAAPNFVMHYVIILNIRTSNDSQRVVTALFYSGQTGHYFAMYRCSVMHVGHCDLFHLYPQCTVRAYFPSYRGFMYHRFCSRSSGSRLIFQQFQFKYVSNKVLTERYLMTYCSDGNVQPFYFVAYMYVVLCRIRGRS